MYCSVDCTTKIWPERRLTYRLDVEFSCFLFELTENAVPLQSVQRVMIAKCSEPLTNTKKLKMRGRFFKKQNFIPHYILVQNNCNKTPLQGVPKKTKTIEITNNNLIVRI